MYRQMIHTYTHAVLPRSASDRSQIWRWTNVPAPWPMGNSAPKSMFHEQWGYTNNGYTVIGTQCDVYPTPVIFGCV